MNIIIIIIIVVIVVVVIIIICCQIDFLPHGEKSDRFIYGNR